MTQTLAQGGTVGSHTLGVEFRTGDTNLLRRAAQNYRVEAYGEENNTGTDGEDGGNNRNDFESENDGGMENGNSSVAENTVRIKEADNGNLASLRESGRTIVYTVEAGDSLWKIAEKFYGSGEYWKKIFADNMDTVREPDKIYVGQKLTIYLTQEDLLAASDAAEGGSYYTVQSGDTLWKISLKVYGLGWHWRKIYRANADVIKNPGEIFAGQKLFIPQ